MKKVLDWKFEKTKKWITTGKKIRTGLIELRKEMEEKDKNI